LPGVAYPRPRWVVAGVRSQGTPRGETSVAAHGTRRTSRGAAR